MISAVILVVWWVLRNAHSSWLFYVLFALAITVSVQLVDVYLVFASLIIPALASYSLKKNRALITAYAIGITGYALGLVGSCIFDMSSGSMIVWVLAFTWLAALGILRSMEPVAKRPETNHPVLALPLFATTHDF